MANTTNKKFKELVIYIALKCKYDLKFGATKLNKILFFCDFLHYGKFGQSLTGEEYYKLERGPAPKRFLQFKDEMLNKDVAEEEAQYFDKTQKRLIPLRKPDLTVFTQEEIAFVDEVIEKLEDANACELSKLSHDKSVGWWNVKIKETIPYETIFFPNPDEVVHSEEDRVNARNLIRRFGWDAKYGWNF